MAMRGRAYAFLYNSAELFTLDRKLSNAPLNFSFPFHHLLRGCQLDVINR